MCKIAVVVVGGCGDGFVGDVIWYGDATHSLKTPMLLAARIHDESDCGG